MSVENLGLARVHLRARMVAAVMLFGSIIPSAFAVPVPGGGMPIGGQYNASDAPASYQSRHQVAVDAVGNSVVVWEDNATGAGGAWTIKGRCFDASGLPKANSFLISSNSSSGAQRFPAVAMNATGDFMVAWEDFNGSATDQSHRIDARRFTAACDVSSAGSQFVVRASAGDEAHTPSVALTGGGDSWIFWNDNFVAKGAKYSAFLTMPSATITESQAGFQYAPVVAVDASGNVALAFTLKDLTSNFDIYAQGFASNGSALTGAASTAAVLINTTTVGVQDTPSISMNASGKLVIAWESDASGKEVQAQIFQLSKNIPQTFSPVGTEITVVAPSTTHLQAAPSVAMDYAGNFWVAWQDVDTSGPGITARWYSASGSGFPGAAIRVNATMANAQVLPTIAADTDGDLLTAWIDQGAEGQAADDVQLRRFSGHESVDLSLTGSDSPSPVVAGSNLAYTLTVNNLHALTQNAGVNDTSIGAANGIYLSDTLPNNVSYSGYSGTGWTCSNAAQVINCTYANTLLPATSASLTINVVPSSLAVGGTITNVTTVGANQYDSSVANNTLTDTQSVPYIYNLSASANALSFNDTNVGSSSAAQSVTLTNTGNSPITFSANAFTASGTNPADFNIVAGSDLCSAQSIAVGSTCSVSLKFSPSASGSRVATETVSTVQTLSSAVGINLSGTGLQGILQLNRGSLTFPNQVVNTTSTSQSITLSNTGNGALSVTMISVGPGFSQNNNCLPMVAAGSSCTINVSFLPGSNTSYSAALTILSNAPEGTDTVTLAGVGLSVPKADLVWYNAATGQTSVWLMDGSSSISTMSVLTDPNWKVTGTADFNGDGLTDLLWYNAATGQTMIWLMNGANATSKVVVLTNPNWKVTATPDLNGDGKADLLWYNAATGQTSAWLMNGTVATTQTALLGDPNWKVTATADLNGDGKADLLWYNATTGQTSAWLMNGTSTISSAKLLLDPNWKITATGDLDGDGKADLLWYNASTGQTMAWLMNGTAVVNQAVLLTNTSWKVIATADFSGDHKADLLWYNATTGQTSAWLMNGLSSTSTAALLTDLNWKVISTTDFNGDGKADLLWYNATSGQTTVWLMNGTVATSKVGLLTDPNWKTTQ